MTLTLMTQHQGSWDLGTAASPSQPPRRMNNGLDASPIFSCRSRRRCSSKAPMALSSNLEHSIQLQCSKWLDTGDAGGMDKHPALQHARDGTDVAFCVLKATGTQTGVAQGAGRPGKDGTHPAGWDPAGPNMPAGDAPTTPQHCRGAMGLEGRTTQAMGRSSARRQPGTLLPKPCRCSATAAQTAAMTAS